jgi:hypothetical protein
LPRKVQRLMNPSAANRRVARFIPLALLEAHIVAYEQVRSAFDESLELRRL